MGTARSVFFTVSSIIMIVSGIGSLILIPFMLTDRNVAGDSSRALIFICCGLIFICSVLNIISGIKGLGYVCRRSNSAVIIRIPQASVILCLTALIFSFINGVSLIHMAVIIASCIVIPDIYMYAAVRKSYD